VLYLRDLGIMPHSVQTQTQTQTVQRVWEQNWAAMQCVPGRLKACAARLVRLQ